MSVGMNQPWFLLRIAPLPFVLFWFALSSLALVCFVRYYCCVCLALFCFALPWAALLRAFGLCVALCCLAVHWWGFVLFCRDRAANLRFASHCFKLLGFAVLCFWLALLCLALVRYVVLCLDVWPCFDIVCNDVLCLLLLCPAYLCVLHGFL